MVSLFSADIVPSNNLFIIEIIEPPKAINKNCYWCDKHFHIEEIKELFEKDQKSIGVILIGGTESYYYKVIGDKLLDYKLIDKFEIMRDKRQKKGGQSAHRFQMNRLGQLNLYAKEIYDRSKKNFTNIKDVIIAGSSEIRDRLKNDLNKEFNIIGNLNISKIDIKEIIPKIKEIYVNAKDDEIDIDFYVREERIVFGIDILNYLKDNNLEKIYINKNIQDTNDIKEIIKICENDNNKCKIIKVKNSKLEKFGSIIGITYYKINNI